MAKKFKPSSPEPLEYFQLNLAQSIPLADILKQRALCLHKNQKEKGKEKKVLNYRLQILSQGTDFQVTLEAKIAP